MFTLKSLLKLCFIIIIFGLLSLTALYMSMRSDLPNVHILKEIQWQTPLQIFSADGKLISQFGEKKRIPLTLDKVPQQLINAILATEDDRFYVHFGVDPTFAPATKAHPAFVVTDIDRLSDRLVAAGHKIYWDTKLVGVRRFFVFDPVGNRIEMIAG